MPASMVRPKISPLGAVRRNSSSRGRLPTGPVAWVWTWYGLLAMWVVAKPFRRWVLLASIVLLGVSAFLAFYPRSVLVEIAPSGSGRVFLLRLPHFSSVLVNTGPREHSRELIRWLRQRGINRLGALVLGRSGSDYTGAAGEVLQAVRVRELWCVPARTPEDILASARQRGVVIRALAAGQQGHLPRAVEWEVLWPLSVANRTRRADENSVVLRFMRGTQSLLLMNGAGEKTMEALLSLPVNPAATALAASPSAATNRLGQAWRDAVGARDIFISDDTTEGYVPKSLLDEWNGCGYRVRRMEEPAAPPMELEEHPAGNGR